MKSKIIEECFNKKRMTYFNKIRISGYPLLKSIEVIFSADIEEGGGACVWIYPKPNDQNFWDSITFTGNGTGDYSFLKDVLNIKKDFRFEKKLKKNYNNIPNSEFAFDCFLIPFIKQKFEIFKLKFEILKNKRHLNLWVNKNFKNKDK